MTIIPYKKPEYNEHTFNCPYCHAFSSMSWVYYERDTERIAELLEEKPKNENDIPDEEKQDEKRRELYELAVARCLQCHRKSVWINGEMIFPSQSSYPAAHQDMPDGVKELYEEASKIGADSPRAAVALLRVATAKGC